MAHDTSVFSRQQAAQAWCDPRASHLEMDVGLAEVFAEMLDEVKGQPWLGNATTRQLLDEISARVDLNYKTVDGDTDEAVEIDEYILEVADGEGQEIRPEDG